jgi:adenine-specific DNA-methyltransferase
LGRDYEQNHIGGCKMSTNISKKKRDDLLDKIKQIRAFIAAAPQDENTGNLLSYLSELEKDVNGKKYGLVFEEHREEIDEVLDTHTPVLTEDADLFIDHGGQMNFLLEGDNLAALKLLEKTHRGKIDLIYIDPPYNTGNKDFIYDDAFVDKTDGFIHSKWISFMNERLKMARHLLSPQGALVISIGYQEIHNLNLLCQDIFFDRQIVTVTVQTSGGKPNGGFNYTQEYLLFVVPVTFSPSAMNFTGGIERSPFEGLTLSTFDKITRPNQTYPIFIEKSTMKIVGVGKSLAERIANGSYTGDPRDFTFDFDEAPEGAVAIWPISSKGADCVWRLISTRLLHDWELGYIKVSKNKSKACPNEYSLQYLPDGVIRKIEAGVLEIIGREDNLPTLKLGKNETVGSEIPTIWTEKDFFTTKGSTYVRNLFGDKRFPYPKPLEFIVELLRATTTDNSLIVDFFAGSGTTGEAAMLLNRETDGSRRFILCTNNENGICRDVTYERIRRVIDKEDYAASLKYYKVDYVPISDRMYYEYADELLRHIRELVELENGINFTGNEEIAIVLTDEELEIFLDDEGICKRCRKLYMGHDVLLDAQQAQALQEYNIAVNVIPDYYYKELEG